MTKTFLYTILLIATVFFCACERDVPIKAPNTSITPSIPPPSPDSIIYTDIPDINLISNMIPHPSGCGYIPTPSDTIVSDSIDIDLDGVYDMKFINEHYLYWISASSPCYNFNCKISVKMINIIDTIAFYNDEYWWIDELYLNDSIDNNLNYNYYNYPINQPFISYHCTSGPPGIHNFIGEKYLGFKMYRSGKTMFGWVRIESVGYNGVIIRDFAVNQTNNNLILAGQEL